MKSLLLMAMLVLMINSVSVAHLCHDPFRPQERLVLFPEKDLISIEEKGKFRIYIENTFHSPLRDVQLFVENPALETEVEPAVIKKLSPGERAFFLVQLKLRKGFEEGDYPLQISVAAKRAELKPTIERMVVSIEEKRVEPEIQQEKIIPSKEKPAPAKDVPPVEPAPAKPAPEKEVSPVEEKRVEPEIEPGIGQEKIVPFKEEPAPEKEVSPVEEKTEKIEISPEMPPLTEEAVKPQEEKVEVQQEVGEVVVKVEKIPFWKKPYFYIILTLFLVAILIWRKIR